MELVSHVALPSNTSGPLLLGMMSINQFNHATSLAALVEGVFPHLWARTTSVSQASKAVTAKFKTANIFVGASVTKTAKFNARQYFCVYGIHTFTKCVWATHQRWLHHLKHCTTKLLCVLQWTVTYTDRVNSVTLNLLKVCSKTSIRSHGNCKDTDNLPYSVSCCGSGIWCLIVR